MYVFVGQHEETESPLKIYAFPDITENHTLISSLDFDCILANGCQIVSEPKTMVFNRMNVTYCDAEAQVSLLFSVNLKPMTFRYALPGTDAIHSVIGLGLNSTFLEYFNEVNYWQGMRLIFYLDWENMVYFRGDIFEHDKLPLSTPLFINITFYNQSQISSRYLRFCFSNRVDLNSHETSYFAIKEGLYQEWHEMLLTQKRVSELRTYRQVLYNFTANLLTNDGRNAGKMEFKFDELVDDRYTVLIRSFDDLFDEGRGCDIYTGTKLLRKFNFRFYYVEDDFGDYRQLFSYDGFHGFEKTTLIHDENSMLWLQIFFNIVFFSFGGFLVYQCLLKENEEVFYRDTEMNIQDEFDDDDDYYVKQERKDFHVTSQEIDLLTLMKK